jgi:hypothetical protein
VRIGCGSKNRSPEDILIDLVDQNNKKYNNNNRYTEDILIDLVDQNYNNNKKNDQLNKYILKIDLFINNNDRYV